MVGYGRQEDVNSSAGCAKVTIVTIVPVVTAKFRVFEAAGGTPALPGWGAPIRARWKMGQGSVGPESHRRDARATNALENVL
jgi:hypothetical protein